MTEGPLWLQYVMAFGTVGAAIFAGWAAWTARTTTMATRRLVELEVARDERVATRELWRQPRRVTVDLISRRSEQPDCRAAEDVRVRVLNDSPDPIRRPRLGVLVNGEERWGPQLLPTIPPWSSASLTARIYADVKEDFDAFVRFADVEGNYWLASARKDLRQDQRPNSEWIEAGQKWSSRMMSAEERGTVAPDIHESTFDFDEWLVSIKTEGEAWQPDVPSEPGEI